MEEEFNKIPFDDEPIIRQSSGRKKRIKEGGGFSAFAKLVVCLLLITNIVLLGFLIDAKKESVSNVSQYTINPTVIGTDMSVAVSKASLSVVCVAVGKNSDNNYADSISTFYTVESLGAGTIFKDNKASGVAYIITNYHVVSADTANIYVLLYGSQTPIQASCVGYSSSYDIAVLKIMDSDEYKKSSSSVCDLGDSSMICMGDSAVAIGNPAGMGFSSTVGNISSPYEYINMQINGNSVTLRVIRTDAAINPGNSGGGLFDNTGKFIGVVNAKALKMNGQDVDNIGFAIPSNLAVAIANNIIANGQLRTVSLSGIELEIDSQKSVVDEKTSKTRIDYVMKIKSLMSGYRISSCGIRLNDILLSISYNDQTFDINRPYTLEDNIFNCEKGTTIIFKVKRMVAGVATEMNISFTVAETDLVTIS